MTLWILNPPEPTGSPTKPEVTGMASSDVSLWTAGLTGGDCGACKAVPDTWLLTPGILSFHQGLSFSGEGKTQFLLKRKPYHPQEQDKSVEVAGCAWISDEIVKKTGSSPAFAGLENGTQSHPRFALVYGRTDEPSSIGGGQSETAWWLIDYGHIRFTSGATRLGARWFVAEDENDATAQTFDGAVHRFQCLCKNRFLGHDESVDGTVARIEPYYG